MNVEALRALSDAATPDLTPDPEDQRGGLDALQALSDAATPGPWEVRDLAEFTATGFPSSLAAVDAADDLSNRAQRLLAATAEPRDVTNSELTDRLLSLVNDWDWSKKPGREKWERVVRLIRNFDTRQPAPPAEPAGLQAAFEAGWHARDRALRDGGRHVGSPASYAAVPVARP